MGAKFTIFVIFPLLILEKIKEIRKQRIGGEHNDR